MTARWVTASVVAGSRVRPIRGALRQLTARGVVGPRYYQHLHVSPRFRVAVEPGVSFEYVSSDADSVGRHLFWSGLDVWERATLDEFVPRARTARGFLDIGAFTGAYSLLAASLNPSLQAVAFEPVSGVYERMVRNLELNGLTHRVKAVNAAVSSENGTARFYVPSRELPDTGHLETSLRHSSEAGEWEEVATTTVTAALPPGFPVDIVKIDVEDTEGPVVSSMRDVLAAYRPVVFIEFLASGSYAEAAGVLASLGYSFFHLGANGRRAVPRPEPVAGDPYMNFMCLPT